MSAVVVPVAGGAGVVPEDEVEPAVGEVAVAGPDPVPDDAGAGIALLRKTTLT